MSRKSKPIATLKIWRGAARDAGHFETHEVSLVEGQSVLDGLRWLRVNKDASLAVRYSCINANACKECMIRSSTVRRFMPAPPASSRAK